MSATQPLMTVAFDGDTLYLVDHDGEPYVPIKPIAEALGISWASQTVKLDRYASRWTISMIETVAADGAARDMLCMPLRKLPAYLYSIDARKVKEAARPKVERYQGECDDALWAYWSQGLAINPRGPAGDGCAALIEELSGVRLELSALAAENLRLKARVIDLQDYKIRQLEAEVAPRPKREPAERLSEQEVAAIHALDQEGHSKNEIARRLGRSSATVSYILRGARASQ